MSKKTKKQNPTKVLLESVLEFPCGITVKSAVKGKLKGTNISVKVEPCKFSAVDAKTSIVARMGKKEVSVEQTEKGFRVV